MNAPLNDGAAGLPHRGLHDLITRHFDGGLSAAEQRDLASRLATSAEARQVLARCLRLEASLIRIAAAGRLGGPAVAVAPVRAVWPAGQAFAAGLAAAIAVVTLVTVMSLPGIPRRPRGQRSGIGTVADHWIELQQAAPAERGATAGQVADDDTGTTLAEDTNAPPTDDALADAASPDTDFPGGAQPPAWLVAAVADEAAEPTPPDAS